MTPKTKVTKKPEKKVMGIIKNVKYGLLERCAKPHLSFSVHTSECLASLQILYEEEMNELFADFQVKDIRELEGKPVWVEVEGNVVKFLGACKI